MVQSLVSFTITTPEDFYKFAKELRKAGVLKFEHEGIKLDLIPGPDHEDNAFDADTEVKRQKIRDAFKTAAELEKEAQEDLEWSMP